MFSHGLYAFGAAQLRERQDECLKFFVVCEPQAKLGGIDLGYRRLVSVLWDSTLY